MSENFWRNSNAYAIRLLRIETEESKRLRNKGWKVPEWVEETVMVVL